MSNTETLRQRIQRTGRIIRRSRGKDRSALYYIYVKDTIESATLLPDVSESVNVIDGSFSGSEFSFRIYSNLSIELLYSIREKADRREMDAVEKALKKGMARNDFLLSSSEIDRKIKEGKDCAYWRTMRELSGLYYNPQTFA